MVRESQCELAGTGYSIFLVAVVGFEETVYRASEEIGMIDVCVVIKSETNCPVIFPFEVDLSTVAGSAG